MLFNRIVSVCQTAETDRIRLLSGKEFFTLHAKSSDEQLLCIIQFAVCVKLCLKMD